ncbi:hypothetical protein [Bradyrhizobium prioriisuperbiae]|uniref:hypothetical protein n=1 Tax=Bradyrhizobium prioriisuperbiae TaxID=2854389 RepID=UPI0028E4C387|nr:hypothetical protein [Bradyrhizobium prioritasuperba]
MSPPPCGAQQPGSVPSPFSWPGFAAVGTGVTGVGAGYAAGVALYGASAVAGAYVFTAGAAGAAAILALVIYFAFQADGCIISPTKGQAICLSGIVQDSTDTSDTAIAVLAPYAMGPAGLFNVVVKTIYLSFVNTNAFWVYCNGLGAPMLPCVIKSKTACGAKIGSLVGVTAGAIAGAFLGYFAAAALGAAIGCAASGPFYLLCLLVVLIVAAIVAAVVAIVGAMIGGWIGEGIAAAANDDPVGDAWKSIAPGTIVTVQGNWITDPDIGNNELFYTTSINRTGQFATPPGFTAADADSTAADDCPIAPAPIK